MFVASLQSTKAKGAVFVVSLYVLTLLLFVASLQSFFFLTKYLSQRSTCIALVFRACVVCLVFVVSLYTVIFSVRVIFIFINIREHLHSLGVPRVLLLLDHLFVYMYIYMI